MSKLSLVISILTIISVSTPTWSQEEPKEILLSKKTFGISMGTGLFQQVRMNLTNFDQTIIAVSENLIPLSFKANFNYHFTLKLALRFSSGYGFSRQKIYSEIDYGIINLRDSKIEDGATFSMTGFPAEIALLFQTPIDVRANLFVHFGIGVGYYAYNYQAEGISKELTSKTLTPKWKESYLNPQMTLSGSAQFFILGFDLNISPRIGATLEMSKVGLSMMRLKGDILKQEVEAGTIATEKKYGYYRQDYPVQNGFEDIAVSFGIFWQL